MAKEPNLYQEIVQRWLAILIPELVEKGMTDQDILAITEHLIVGTLYVCKRGFGTDPQQVFEIMKRQVDQRLADMEGEAAERRIIQG
jgi:hypothetical protein